MPILMYKGVNLSGSGMSASSSLDDASENSVATTKITNELNKSKAPLESPEFTGTPVVPTADKGISNTQIANTEYVQKEITEIKKSVSDGKTLVANAITEKGIETAADATFVTIADNISKIETGVDTSDATATSDKIVLGEVAYVNGEKIIGTLGVKTSIDDNKATNLSDGLSVGRQFLSGASVGNYAIFAGGVNVTGTLSTVDIYNRSFTRIESVLSVARSSMSGASFGDYAIFAGGFTDHEKVSSSVVDAYNKSLSKSTLTSLGNGRGYLSSAVIGSHVLFAGGSVGGTSMTSTVDVYNKSLTKVTVASLSKTACSMAGGTIGDYAIFAGGSTGFGSYTATVDAYNTSLVRTNPTSLSKSRFYSAVANVGEYVLVAGGYNNGVGQLNNVDAYNKSLVKSTPTELSVARWSSAGNSVGNYAMIAGGYSLQYNSLSTVDTYDSSLTRGTALQALSTARTALASTKLGHHVFFAGGGSSNTCSTVVDIYSNYTGDIITIPETVFYLN